MTTIVSRQDRRIFVYAYIDKKCSLCKGKLRAKGGIAGHNPQPYKNLKVTDRVCNHCHEEFVIPARKEMR